MPLDKYYDGPIGLPVTDVVMPVLFITGYARDAAAHAWVFFFSALPLQVAVDDAWTRGGAWDAEHCR